MAGKRITRTKHTAANVVAKVHLLTVGTSVAISAVTKTGSLVARTAVVTLDVTAQVFNLTVDTAVAS